MALERATSHIKVTSPPCLFWLLPCYLITYSLGKLCNFVDAMLPTLKNLITTKQLVMDKCDSSIQNQTCMGMLTNVIRLFNYCFPSLFFPKLDGCSNWQHQLLEVSSCKYSGKPMASSHYPSTCMLFTERRISLLVS